MLPEKATKNRVSSIALRRIAEPDKRLLFYWRNIQEIIDLSGSQSAVTWEQHELWFNTALDVGNPLIYIIVENQKPIGQIRFDMHGKGATISIYLVGKNKGKGRGSFLIAAGVERLKADIGDITEVFAFIRTLNKRSVRSFESAGFKADSSGQNSHSDIRKYRLSVG